MTAVPGKVRRDRTSGDETAQQILTRFVADLMDRYHADLEMMCQIALTGGKHGVLVTWDDPTHYTIRVSRDVPYGQIHEHQSSEEYR